MSTVLFILVLLCASEGRKPASKIGRSRLIPRFEIFDNCKNQNFSGARLTGPGKIQYLESIGEYGVDLNLNVERFINPFTLGLMRIHNCNDPSYAVCQLFQTWRFQKNACALFSGDNQIWSPMFRRFRPDLHCPIASVRRSRLIPRFDLFENCRNQNFSGMSLTSPGKMEYLDSIGEYVVNFDLDVVRLINPLTLSIFRIQNCNDPSFAVCQLFQTWRFRKNSCTMLTSDHQIWSPIFRRFKPDLHCPVAHGLYILRNGTLDMTLLQRLPFPFEKYYWRVRLECYDPRYFACFDVGLRFMRIRSL